MYFHSKNDSKYISELKQALIKTGLQSETPTIPEQKIKNKSKENGFYKKSLAFSNKKLLKDRKNIDTIESNMRNKIYHYKVLNGNGNLIDLFHNNSANTSIKTNIKTIKFKEISLNILLGAIECFEELRFDNLKIKYPVLTSTKEFLTSDKFLGNSKLEITYSKNELTGKDLFLAVKYVLTKVATHVMSLNP